MSQRPLLRESRYSLAVPSQDYSYNSAKKLGAFRRLPQENQSELSDEPMTQEALGSSFYEKLCGAHSAAKILSVEFPYELVDD